MLNFFDAFILPFVTILLVGVVIHAVSTQLRLRKHYLSNGASATYPLLKKYTNNPFVLVPSSDLTYIAIYSAVIANDHLIAEKLLNRDIRFAGPNAANLSLEILLYARQDLWSDANDYVVELVANEHVVTQNSSEQSQLKELQQVISGRSFDTLAASDIFNDILTRNDPSLPANQRRRTWFLVLMIPIVVGLGIVLITAVVMTT